MQTTTTPTRARRQSRDELSCRERQLVQKNLRLAWRFLRRYGHYLSPEQAEDLRGELLLALCHAAQDWQPRRGAFTTLAWWHLRRTVSEFFSRKIREDCRRAISLSQLDEDDRPIGGEWLARPGREPGENELFALARPLLTPREYLLLVFFCLGYSNADQGRWWQMQRSRVGQIVQSAVARLRKRLGVTT